MLYFIYPFLFVLALLNYGDHATQKAYTLSPGYAVSIHGTLSSHSWSENIEKVTGDLEGSTNEDGSVDVYSIRIVMGARSIKGDMGAVMNKKTYKALKADANPEITFLLTTPVRLRPISGGERSVILQGNLTLAGVSRPVLMLIRSFTSSKGTMSFEGEQKIKMTDFGVRPPSALFGAMRASPDITIDFKTDFTIKQQ
jgi:polyisoprenoid-binding protein YceI